MNSPSPERIFGAIRGLLESRHGVTIELQIRESKETGFFCVNEVAYKRLLERKQK